MEPKNQDISSVEEFLKGKAADKSAVFVFATDVVSQSWADWCVTNHTKVKSVAMNRFLAWDTFKGRFVSAQKEGYSAVPSVLRKMFVYTLIAENAENQIFKKIINPAEEFRKDAYSFADWISKNLSSLHIWKKRLEQCQNYGELDDEDKDYETLYERYSAFLEKNKLFEPAWVDEITLTDKKNHYYIFYPEQLEDFIDYEEIFTKAGNVTFLHLLKETRPAKCFEFPDSRTELRKTILRIINLVNSKKADWTEIALTVPDFETYRPYLKRELELYSVPYVLKMGEPLSKNCAGRIFKEILNCHNEEFSFDSVRTFLLDETLPWKAEFESLKNDLIRIGNEHRCICFFDEKKNEKTQHVDIWQRVLYNLAKSEEKENRLSSNVSTDSQTTSDNGTKRLDNAETTFNDDFSGHNRHAKILELYNKFKHYVGLFFEKDTNFAKILSDWYQFRNYFLETKDFESNNDFKASNLILSRCITHLKEIIEVEKNFGEQLKIQNPFEFFVKFLDEKSYKMQQSENGLSVFDYKLSASANFKYQFVINASQKMLEIQKKRLNFLNQEKRQKLGFVADDLKMNTSDVTAKLYARPTESPEENFVHFSYAADSFSGFAIPHASLEALEKTEPEDLAEDYILAEKKWIENQSESQNKNLNESALSSGNCVFITQNQRKSLENWKNSAMKMESENKYSANQKIKENVEFVLKTNRMKVNEFGGNQNHIKISARGDLEKFFPCPRIWVLKQILHLKDDSLDTDLMQNYDMGNLNHKILEKFLTLYKGKTLPWYDSKNDRFMGEDKEKNGGIINAPDIDVTEKMKCELYGKLVEDAIKSEFRGLPLVLHTLNSQKNQIADVVWNFLKKLLLPFNECKTTNASQISFNGIGNCVVAGLEETLASDCGAYDLFGKLDCLAKTPDGDFIILDYKNTSASVPSATEIKVDTDTGILGDFQMPLYANLVASDENQKKRPGDLFAAYFYAIKDGAKRAAFDETEGIKEDKKLKLADFEATMETLKEYAELFKNQTENFDFEPHSSHNKKDRLNVNKFQNCAKCQFKTICRTTFTVGERGLSLAEIPLKDDSDFAHQTKKTEKK